MPHVPKEPNASSNAIFANVDGYQVAVLSGADILLIDAGHGGIDGGAEGADGTPEKDNFDATSTDPYFSQSEEILCEWNTENTHVELTAKYDGNSSTMGCNMLLKVNSNKRK